MKRKRANYVLPIALAGVVAAAAGAGFWANAKAHAKAAAPPFQEGLQRFGPAFAASTKIRSRYDEMVEDWKQALARLQSLQATLPVIPNQPRCLQLFVASAPHRVIAWDALLVAEINRLYPDPRYQFFILRQPDRDDFSTVYYDTRTCLFWFEGRSFPEFPAPELWQNVFVSSLGALTSLPGMTEWLLSLDPGLKVPVFDTLSYIQQPPDAKFLETYDTFPKLQNTLVPLTDPAVAPASAATKTFFKNSIFPLITNVLEDGSIRPAIPPPPNHPRKECRSNMFVDDFQVVPAWHNRLKHDMKRYNLIIVLSAMQSCFSNRFSYVELISRWEQALRRFQEIVGEVKEAMAHPERLQSFGAQPSPGRNWFLSCLGDDVPLCLKLFTLYNIDKETGRCRVTYSRNQWNFLEHFLTTGECNCVCGSTLIGILQFQFPDPRFQLFYVHQIEHIKLAFYDKVKHTFLDVEPTLLREEKRNGGFLQPRNMIVRADLKEFPLQKVVSISISPLTGLLQTYRTNYEMISWVNSFLGRPPKMPYFDGAIVLFGRTRQKPAPAIFERFWQDNFQSNGATTFPALLNAQVQYPAEYQDMILDDNRVAIHAYRKFMKTYILPLIATGFP